jgi:hypothetical protein
VHAHGDRLTGLVVDDCHGALKRGLLHDLDADALAPTWPVVPQVAVPEGADLAPPSLSVTVAEGTAASRVYALELSGSASAPSPPRVVEVVWRSRSGRRNA